MNFMGFKFNLVNIAIALLIGSLIGSTLLCSCSKVNVKEGLAIMGAEIGWNMSQGVPGDTWANARDNDLQSGNTTNMYAALKNNVGGEVPLPEDQMNFFYANKFDPACCFKPQQYSTGAGCACISVEQMKYLNERGGNNTVEN